MSSGQYEVFPLDVLQHRSDATTVLRTSTLTRTQRERRSSSSTDSSLISASLRSNEATNAKPGAFSRVWTGSLNIIGRANDWKKSSRFHGWQWGVFTGACVGTIVLLLNIIFAIIPLASQHGYEQGVATLFVDTSTKIETWNSLLHVLINVLSTLLLSASNYAMQVLCAPTRSQCINAHMSGKTIDIGVFSFRNVTSISGKRRLLWITLALSSVPLHLFYNAAIFKVVTGNDYRLELDDYDFGSDEWVSHYKDSALTWFSGNNLTSTYHEEKMSEYGDITLLIERIAIEFSHSDYASGMNKTLYLPSIEFPAILRTSDANEWANKINDQGYIEIAHLDSDWSSTIESPALNGILMLKIRGGFGRVGLRNSKIQMSLTFIIIVIFANATKVACLVVMLFQEDDETKAPMVTIGDAVASFLEKPDESTKNHCCWSQNEYFWKIGRIRRTRAREEDGRAATLDRRCQGVWERKRYQYGVALSESKRILLTIGGFGIPFAGIVAFSMGVIPLTAWGTASPAHSSFGRERFDGQGTAVLALIANSPQLLISLIYLFYNQTFTSMAQAYAWNQLGVHRKSLRVSKPAGEQRETYFLHLPLRWGVPLNSISGLLHWLTAQTLFVVRLDHRGRDGTLQVGQSIAACGFSGSGFLAIIVVLLLLLLLATVLALISFEARVPFAGSCSWIISAACHPPRDEVNAALGRVKWGVVLGAGSADDPGHCSFSSGPVKKPKAGRSYK